MGDGSLAIFYNQKLCVTTAKSTLKKIPFKKDLYGIVNLGEILCVKIFDLND